MSVLLIIDCSLESAAADKIRNYRDAYAVNRQVAFLPACMSTSGREGALPIVLLLHDVKVEKARETKAGRKALKQRKRGTRGRGREAYLSLHRQALFLGGLSPA
jgi:hypothetical protein